MSRKILIKNFGPVKTAEVDLDKNFQIFIGEQASGVYSTRVAPLARVF